MNKTEFDNLWENRNLIKDSLKAKKKEAAPLLASIREFEETLKIFKTVCFYQEQPIQVLRDEYHNYDIVSPLSNIRRTAYVCSESRSWWVCITRSPRELETTLGEFHTKAQAIKAAKEYVALGNKTYVGVISDGE